MRKLKDEEKKAVETIEQVISDYRTGLEAITLVKPELECDPVLIEGETSTGYYCQMMIDPREIAPILLEFNYPVFAVLQEEPPKSMYYRLSAKLGLDKVISFDL